MKTSLVRRTVFHCLTFAAAVAASIAASPPPVLAADMPAKAPEPVVVRPVWTGYYFGVHGGWGWASSFFNDPVLDHPTNMPAEYRSNGPIAGGQIGANWQYGNVVVGLEVDGSWASMRSTSETNPVPGQFRDGVDTRALATATGRVGYTMGYWLAYLKAGGAWANIRFVTGNLGPELVTHFEDRFGLTVGTGMEVAFLRNVSAKIEYNYIYLPQHELRFIFHGSNSTVDHNIHLVKAGFNVRFGGDYVAAR